MENNNTERCIKFKLIEDELFVMNSLEEEQRCITMLLGILRGNNKLSIRAIKSTLASFYNFRNKKTELNVV